MEQEHKKEISCHKAAIFDPQCRDCVHVKEVAHSVADSWAAKRKEELLSLIEMGEKMKRLERWTENIVPMISEENISFNEGVEHYQKIIREKLG